jgi:hypothetical protein
MKKKLKTLLRRYGHRYYKEAHNRQDYDSIDKEFIPQILELLEPYELPTEMLSMQDII